MKPIAISRRLDLGTIIGAEVLLIPTSSGLRVVVVDDLGNDMSMTLNLAEMQEAVMTAVEEYLAGELFTFSQIDPLSLPASYPPIGHTHPSAHVSDFEQHIASTKRRFTSQQGLKTGTLTDAPSVNWDADSDGQIVFLNTAGARIINAPTGIIKRNLYLLTITANGYTPSWNVVFKWPPNGAPNSLGSGVYVYAFIGWDNGALVPLSPGYKGAL